MKKNLLLLILFSFFSIYLYGQNRIIDSLSNLVNSTTDTTKALAICELIERKIDIYDIDDISFLFEEGINISEEHDFKKGLIKLLYKLNIKQKSNKKKLSY